VDRKQEKIASHTHTYIDGGLQVMAENGTKLRTDAKQFLK
jgi:hypothetical protein